MSELLQQVCERPPACRLAPVCALRYITLHYAGYSADASIQSNLRLIRLSRRQIPLEQCGVKGLAQAVRILSACSVAVKLLDLDPQGRWFDPWCGHDKICTAVGPLSKALNPALLQGVCLLLSLINCKSLWIKASAKKRGPWVSVLIVATPGHEPLTLRVPVMHLNR